MLHLKINSTFIPIIQGIYRHLFSKLKINQWVFPINVNIWLHRQKRLEYKHGDQPLRDSTLQWLCTMDWATNAIVFIILVMNLLCPFVQGRKETGFVCFFPIWFLEMIQILWNSASVILFSWNIKMVNFSGILRSLMLPSPPYGLCLVPSFLIRGVSCSVLWLHHSRFPIRYWLRALSGSGMRSWRVVGSVHFSTLVRVHMFGAIHIRGAKREFPVMKLTQVFVVTASL